MPQQRNAFLRPLPISRIPAPPGPRPERRAAASRRRVCDFGAAPVTLRKSRRRSDGRSPSRLLHFRAGAAAGRGRGETSAAGPRGSAGAGEEAGRSPQPRSRSTRVLHFFFYCQATKPANMSLDDIHMSTEDLLDKQQLDAGGYGKIYLCFHRTYGYVVLKTVYTGPQRTECNASLLEEGRIMRSLQHDRVVKLLGVILEDGNYSLVMEYVHRGNMMKVLQKVPVPLSVKGRFILEITEGMLYLHEQGLVHKDLKPENILVDKDFHIKIADLGVASFKNWSRLTKEETCRQKKIKSACQNNAGTLFYMAPEHLNDVNVKPVEKSDIYSFGIVIWAIFANKEPYENCINEDHIYFGIIHGNRPDIEEIIEKCPKEIIDLMKQCWEQKAENRPTFSEISENYTPFYYQNLEKNIEDDLKKIEETWPESEELLQRMKSLQIDAVGVDTSNGQIDQPNSLHSSQGQINEALFAACPENQPVESCETSFTSPDNLERKLEREYDYHAFGSRMDKPVVPPYTPEMRERERKQKVSHDPFAKLPSVPHWSELYHKAENIGSNTNPWFWPKQAAIPTQGNLDNFYGPNISSLLTGNTEDLYDPSSTSAISLSKTPVPESRPNLAAQSSASQQQKNAADTDTEDSIMYNITNSSGIQIGSHNHMKIEEQNQHISTSSVAKDASYSYYESTGIFDNNTVLTKKQLSLVRENLGKQWKHCARELGFSNSVIEEIDHDYERDGLKEKVHQMLHKWIMGQGSKGATVGKIAKALFGCRKLDLLTSLMQMSEE